MALTSKSLILFGFEVDVTNYAIDFKTSALGAEKQASLRYGFYSLTSLCEEMIRALTEADPSNIYTYTIDRTISGGTQNRVTLYTSGVYLSLLFATGSRASASVGPLLGYTATDKTGATNYTSQTRAGTTLQPEYIGYNYLGPEFSRRVQGTVTISASGEKEAVVFAIQRFIQVEFKWEPQSKVIAQWASFWNWAIQQRLFEFTPEISSPNTFYQVTLEQSGSDGKGLGYQMTEMLPEFPFYYRTGVFRMRQRLTDAFIL
jgi:hypothetical protein